MVLNCILYIRVKAVVHHRIEVIGCPIVLHCGPLNTVGKICRGRQAGIATPKKKSQLKNCTFKIKTLSAWSNIYFVRPEGTPSHSIFQKLFAIWT